MWLVLLSYHIHNFCVMNFCEKKSMLLVKRDAICYMHDIHQNSAMPALGAMEYKLVYQLNVDEGNRRREGDNS